MKFKYKKIICVITMCTMWIGLVTMSLTDWSNSKNRKKDSRNKVEGNFVDMSDTASLKEDAGLTEESQLQESKNEEINQLVQQYMNCFQTCDLETMAKVVTDVECIDVSEMQAKQKLIQEYKNMECYTVQGLHKGEYLVYVYNEVLFTGIDTSAPGLNRLYIITDKDGNLRIESGALKQEVHDFIEKTDQSADVQKIIQTVNTKLEEAINNDEKFRAFYTKLNGGSDTVVSNNPKGDSKEPTPTDLPMEETDIVNE